VLCVGEIVLIFLSRVEILNVKRYR